MLQLIDDETASRYYNEIDTATGDDLQTKISALESWATAKKAEQHRQEWDHVSGVFTDFDNYSASEGLDAFDEESRYQYANRQFIAHQTGGKFEDQMFVYPSKRDEVTEQLFGKTGVSEKEAFNLFKGAVEARRASEEALRELPGVLAKSVLQSASEGNEFWIEEPDSWSGFNEWKDRHADKLGAMPAGWETAILDTAIKNVAGLESMMSSMAPESKRAMDVLMKVTRPEDAESLPDADRTDVENLAKDFAKLTPEQRNGIYTTLSFAAEADGAGQGKGFWEKVGEGVARGGVNIYDDATMTAEDRQARQNISFFQDLLDKPQAEPDRMQTAESIQMQRDMAQKGLEENQQRLNELRVMREIRDLAQGQIDPIKTEMDGVLGKLVQGAYDFSQSAAYMGTAMVPYVGLPALMAMEANRNYLRMIDEYPGIDPDAAFNISLAVGGAMGVAGRLQGQVMLGKLPGLNQAMKRLTDVRVPLPARLGLGYAGVVGAETLTEWGQDAMPIVADQIAAAVREDMPEFNADKAWGEYREQAPGIFYSMLWGGLIGGGAVGIRELDRTGVFMRNVQELEMHGITGEAAQNIAAEQDADKATTMFREAWDKRTPEDIQAGISKRAAMLDAAQATQANPDLPTRRMEQAPDGTTTHIIEQNGQAVYRTSDPAAADMALINITRMMDRSRITGTTTGIVESLQFIDQVNQATNRGEDVQKLLIDGAPRTLLDDYEANPTEQNLDNLFATVRAFGQDISEPAELANFPVLASNQGALAEGIFKSVIRIQEGATGVEVMRDFSQDNLKRAIAENRVTMNWVREQLNQVIPLIESDRLEGRSLRTETDTDVIESFSDVAVAYMNGRIRDEQIPAGFRGFLRRMAIVVKDIFRRAYRLKRAIAEGKVDANFESFLAESVGLNQQTLVDTTRERVSNEVLADTGATNYSIGADMVVENGRAYSPTVRDLLQRRAAGENIPRSVIDQAISDNFPAQLVEPPKSESDLPSRATIDDAINEGQRRDQIDKSSIQPGDAVTIRQDVPAMTRKGVGVVTIKSKSGNSYDAAARISDPQFILNEKKSLEIGMGGAKGPHIAIRGKWASDQSMPSDLSEWTQVGFNPDRHSFYYDRATMKQVVGGSEAYQIGNTVFVKDAKFGDGQISNISYSIGKKQDADYLAAVERGDMETAQRMVDEAERIEAENNFEVEYGSKIFGEYPQASKVIKRLDGTLKDHIPVPVAMLQTGINGNKYYVRALMVKDDSGIVYGFYNDRKGRTQVIRNLSENFGVWDDPAARNSYLEIAELIAKRAKYPAINAKLKDFAIDWWSTQGDIKPTAKLKDFIEWKFLDDEIGEVQVRRGTPTTGWNKAASKAGYQHLPVAKFKDGTEIIINTGDKELFRNPSDLFASLIHEAVHLIQAKEGRLYKSLQGDANYYSNDIEKEARDAAATIPLLEWAENNLGDYIPGKSNINHPHSIPPAASPVTYDDAGNVIPLSQRFNPRSPNINYSIRSVEHFKNDTRFDKLVKDGRVIIGHDIEEFKGMHILLHSPDNAFAGTIKLTDGNEIQGKGGVYYPALYADKNYFWASTEAMVMRTAKHLNEIGEKNGGKILMGLVSAPVEKLFSSTSMSTGVVKFLKALASDPKGGLSEAELNSMLVTASKVEFIKPGNPPKKFKFTLKENDSFKKNFSKINKLLEPTGSIFEVRKQFVVSLVDQLTRHYKDKPENSEYVAGILTDAENKYAKSAIKKGKLSKASIMQGLGNLLTEPFLRDFQDFGNGKIYAVLEVDGKVDGIPTTEHDSYPATIVPQNKKQKVKLHILKEAVDWQDVVGKETGQYTTKEERLNFMPTSGMSATTLKVLGTKTGSVANPLNYSIASQSEIDRVNKALGGMNRGPDERIAVYERAKAKFSTLLQNNQQALDNLRAGTVSFRRTQLLQALGELDAILSIFPPDIRGRVGGYTRLASIAPHDVFKDGEKVSEVSGMNGAIISAWMREGLSIGPAGQQTELPPGYTAKENLGTARADKAIADFFKKRIEMIDRELEKTLRREYDEAFRKLLDRTKPKKAKPGEKPKGIGGDIQDLFAVVRDSVEMNATQVAAHIAGLDSMIASGELTAEQEARAQIEAALVALTGDWKNADSDRRRTALMEASRIWNGAYAAHAQKIIRQREEREIARAEAIIATGKAGELAGRKSKAIADSGLKGSWKDYILNLLNFDQVVGVLFGENTEVANTIIDKQRQAENAKEDGAQAKMQELEDFFTDLAGGNLLDGERLRYRLTQPSMTVKGIKMSELEALSAVMMWSQEDGRRHMEGEMDEAGRPVGKWHYNQDFVDEILANLSEEALALRSWLTRNYANEYAKINEVYSELNGVNLPQIRNYSPVTVQPVNAPTGQVLDPVSGSAMSGASTSPGALRTRGTAIAEPRFQDVLQTYISHTLQMEHWKAFAPMIAEANGILRNRDVQNSVEEKGGAEARKMLNAWLDYFAQGGTRDAGAHLALNQGLNNVIGRASQVALVGRASTLLIQSTQLGAALAEMPLKAYLKRMGKLLTGQLGWDSALNSDYIQRRVKQMPPVVQLAMQGLKGAKPTAIQQAGKRLGMLLSGADGFFTAGTYAITYDYHLTKAKELGLAGQEAEDYARNTAERVTDRIAQPTRAGARSLYENTSTNPLARAGWAFASEARKNLALVAYSFAERDTATKMRTLAYVVALNAIGSAILRSIWRDILDDEDDELFDDKYWSPKRIATAIATEPLYGFPVLGSVVQEAVYKSFGEYKPSESLFSVQNAIGPIKRLPDHLSGDTDLREVMRDIDMVVSALGIMHPNIAATASITHLAKDLFNLTDSTVDAVTEN